MSMHSSLPSTAKTRVADPVRITKAADLKTSHGQTKGMTRQGAIVELSDHICGNLMRADPHSSSDIHHHGNQDTIVYAVSGLGTIVSDGGKKRHHLSPGDWAIIPAWAEHQEANDGDEEVVWVIVRGPGGRPVVENLNQWDESKVPSVVAEAEEGEGIEQKAGRV